MIGAIISSAREDRAQDNPELQACSLRRCGTPHARPAVACCRMAARAPLIRHPRQGDWMPMIRAAACNDCSATVRRIKLDSHRRSSQGDDFIEHTNDEGIITAITCRMPPQGPTPIRSSRGRMWLAELEGRKYPRRGRWPRRDLEPRRCSRAGAEMPCGFAGIIDADEARATPPVQTTPADHGM